MTTPPQNPESTGLISIGDIYFALFRQKWLILICSLAGLIAGLVYYFHNTPPYESDASLLIRYIVDTRTQTGPTQDPGKEETKPSELADSIINAEMAILTSFDLAEMVVSNIGPDRILAKYGGGDNIDAAASIVRGNLIVEAPPRTTIIRLTFSHPDPALAPVVLREVIADYLLKSQQVHQAGGTSYDFLREQSDLLRDEITATEDELRTAKTNAGIISVEDSDKTFSDQVSTIEQELFQAKAQEAGYQALLKLDSDAPLMDLMQMPSDKLDKYQRLCDRLDLLVRKQNEYVTVLGYKDENTLVKEGKEQIDELKKELTDEYPELATLTTSAMSSGGQASPLAPGGIGGLIPLLTKINILTEQLKQIWMQAADEDMAKSKIVDLQRKKQILEANYQYFATTLEQARIDEVLGPGRLSNISEVDHPSPPYKDLSKFHKMLYQLIGGGVGVGVVLALLLELVLDQRVKRPAEIESKLHLRLFLTIPNFGPGRKNALDRKTPLSLLENSLEASAAAGGGATSPDLPLANTLSLDSNPLLFPYYDTLRDRLISYFENVNLTRKPKLVAVTSTGKGAGVSTIAAGLADALSETGDGRVLLVKMNLEPDAGQSYFNGRPACELDDALLMEKRDDALVQENLYVVEEISRGDKRPRVLPKRFAQLVPKFKASDYDYIIFDMPPVSQTSVTARLAGLVDMTLLVVESEKSNREVVRQAAALLAQSKATVGAVLNKTKKYVPSRLHQNFLEEG